MNSALSYRNQDLCYKLFLILLIWRAERRFFCGILGGIPEGFLIYDSITKSLWFFDRDVEMAQFDL